MFTAFGGTVSWKINMQSIVTLSTAKTKYIAMTKVIKEAIWLKSISHDLWLFSGAITVYFNNQNTMHLANNQINHKRSKHINIKRHFVRNIILLV